MKESRDVSFKSFSDARKDPTFSEDIIDYVKLENRDLLHALYELIDNGDILPTIPYDVSQTETFLSKLSQDFKTNPQLYKLA